MYLKSLQVTGFKSFADRTTVNFHTGVTAIVGPNGCGKSNVLDAIRWVLGEQSAKALRGGEMKDVIFSGTESRKAMSMAEVALTFSDCEKDLGVAYNEVTVTRRLFRDGASEYEINGTTCRLKDIHQLFMDTGIGRTAYSIMEQGKIDLILSSRPEDRRAVFEEAAGITKYKSQKKEALRKLEHTDANLLRLADIIREVKRQIGSLQRQAGKARRYREAFEVLKDMEGKLARHQYDAYSAVIAELEAEVQSRGEGHERLSVASEKLETELAGRRLELQQAEEELAALRDEQNQARNRAERAVSRRDTNKARVVEFTELKERAFLEVSGLAEKIRAQEENLAHLQKQLEEAGSIHAQMQAEFSRCEAESASQEETVRELEARCQQAQKALLEAEQAILSQRSLQETLQQQQRNNETRMENARRQLSALQETESQLQTRLRNAEQTVSASRETREAARGALEQARSREREAIAAEKAAEQECREFERRRESLVARQEALLQLQRDNAGAAPAAQNVLKAAAEGKISNAVKNLLSAYVRAVSGNEKAVAALLHELLDAVVVEHRGQIEEIYNYLRHETNGPCAVAPLDMPRPTPMEATEPRAAIRFVEVDPIVAQMIQSMLANAYIVDSLHEGYDLKNVINDALIATRDGQLISRAGVVMLGRAEQSTALGVFNRQAELQSLSEQIAGLESQAQLFAQRQEDAARLVQTARADVAQAQEKLQAVEIDALAAKSEQESCQRQLQDLVRQKESLESEINRLMEQNRGDQTRRQEIEQKVEQLHSRQMEAREQLSELDRRIAEQEADMEDARQKLTEARIRLATQAQQVESWREQIGPVNTRLVDLKEQAATRRAEAEEHARRIGQAQEEIRQADADETQARAQLAELEGSLSESHKRRVEAVAAIEQTEAEAKKVRKELSELQAARSQMEVKLAQQRIFLDNLRDRMRQQYQIELEQLPLFEEKMAPEDWALLEAEVAEKRRALEAMGPVNLDAITEYDELEQRHQFLENQQKDMADAKEQLLATIKQINQTTQKLFAETFEQVKVNFQQMFSELFGGGKATLVLLDENDPLECGIDIVAKPPGKQLQSVSLLSGGERTMTAVALLFSIYMVKPSPFCVLDEMDAPLDESNINRFIKILKRFVHQSQFVVITHNKRTISMADVLYGVTMEEHGVSKFVSVKLGAKDAAAKNGHAYGASSEESAPSVAESFGKMAELPA